MDRNKKIWLIWVALITTLIVSGCLQQGEQERTGEKPQTPIYSGSEVYSAPTFFYQMIGIPTEGISVKVYYVKDATVSEILNWYKERMKDYVLAEEIPIVKISTPQGSTEWGAILFQKDGQALGIWAMEGMAVEGGKGVVYYIVKGPIEKLVGEKEQLPSGDVVSGEEPIARYPNSVMLAYDKYDNYIIITYGTKDNVDSVFNWYKDYLSGDNWEIKSESKEADRLSLEAEKDSKVVGIVIYPPDAAKDYTEINIHYGVQEEQKPAPVQPTSDFGVELDGILKSVLQTVSEVMLSSYSEFEMEGVININMEYTLSSPVEDVSGFTQTIKTALTDKGFSNVYSSISSNSAEIGFSGEVGGKYIGMATISVYKDSDTVSVFVSAGR